MIEATPRTLLKSAKTVFEEGEKLPIKKHDGHQPFSNPETKQAVKGFIRASEITQLWPPIDNPQPIAYRRPSTPISKPRKFASNSYTTLNNCLILLNVALISLVGFALYMLYTVVDF